MTWILAHENHAIERVSVTFVLSGDVSSKPWNEISKAMTTKLNLDGFVATGVPGGPPLGFQSGTIVFGNPGDSRFMRSEGGQVLEEIAISPRYFTYTTHRYHRWAGFRLRALTLAAPFLNKSLEIENLLVVKMEYWDRVMWSGHIDAVNYSSLLNLESSLIPSYIFDLKGLFHLHSGYFCTADRVARRLINFNLDSLDIATPAQVDQPGEAPKSMRSVAIYTMLQDNLSPGHSSEVDSIFGLDSIHDTLKKLLSRIISPEIAEKIALNAGRDV